MKRTITLRCNKNFVHKWPLTRCFYAMHYPKAQSVVEQVVDK
jgi:hypothetical protein